MEFTEKDKEALEKMVKLLATIVGRIVALETWVVNLENKILKEE